LITGEVGGAGRSENEPAADPDGLVSTLDGLLSAVDEALTPDAAVEDDEDDDEGVDNADATETSGGTPADASRVDDEGDEAGDHDAREADDETGDLHARTSEDEQSAGPRPGASIPEPATPAAEPLPTEPLPLLYPVPRHPAADLTVVLVVADPQEPSLDGVAPTEVTVLAIAPGVSTREQLARLAVAVDEAGRRIDGIVIADPDPSDRTTGRRTLDERARQTPLPMRVTGIGSTPVAISERGTGR
jgi:hypothetical protein